MPKFTSCHNAIMVVTGRAHCSILLYITLQIHSVEHSYGYVIYQQQQQQHLVCHMPLWWSSWIQDGGTCLTRLRFQRNYGSDTKIYTFFNIFFTTFDILTPKLCVQRITKKENVKKLPKLN